MAHDYYWNAYIAMCIVASFTEKFLRLQTDVGCSLNSLFAKRTCRLYATKLRTCTYGDVPMTGGGFDWRFFCDFRIDISVFVRLVWFLSVALSFSLAESSLSSVSHGVLPFSYSVFNLIVNNERTQLAVTRCNASLNHSLALR